MNEQRFQSLSHWGAFTAVVEGDRVVRCEPFARDPSPSPMLDAIPAMVHSPLRVARPAVREGWLKDRAGSDRSKRGREAFVEVGWDEALRLVTGELARVRAEHGASGIFGGSYGWASAGRFHHARTQLRRFLFAGGGCVDQLGNYSWGAAQFLLPHVIGTFAPVTGRVTDWASIVATTKVLVAFGGLAIKNGQVTAGGAGEHTMARWLHAAKDAGVEFVVVSPTRADAPDFLGAQWLPVRPNTDTALMLGIAHALIAERLHDEAFLARYCTGFARLRDYVLGASDGVAKTPEWAEAVCGVPAATIRRLAVEFAISKPAAIHCGYAPGRTLYGEQFHRAAYALAAITGNIGIPGGNTGCSGGAKRRITGRFSPGPNPAEARVASPLLADVLARGRAGGYPADIRMIYSAYGDLFNQCGNVNKTLAALDRVEFIVVHDHFLTPTARHADIVLPATTFLERDDMHVPWSGAGHYAFFMRRAIAPQGECRNDMDICAELASRLGLEGYNDKTDESWLRETCEGTEIDDFEAFRRHGLARLPAPEDMVAFAREVRDPEHHPFSTPSGKIELYSTTLAAKPDVYGLGAIPAVPTYVHPYPDDPGHPLLMVTPKSRARTHSIHDNQPVLSRADRQDVWIHPDDAAARGIADGEQVRVFNERGASVLPARVTDRIARGVVCIKEGAWFSPDAEGRDTRGCANVLTADRSAPSGASTYNTCQVQVAPAERR